MSEIQEIVLKASRGVAGLIPGGSLITEFFETPKERRLKAFLEALDNLVNKLEKAHGIKSGELTKRDDFLDVLYGTTSLWLINSNSEKLKTIFSFLENVAVNPSADGAIDAMVLRTLRDLSGSHLHLILKHREDPRYCESNPEFRKMLGSKGWKSDWGIVHNDLSNMQLIGPGGLTAFGTALLNRISVD